MDCYNDDDILWHTLIQVGSNSVQGAGAPTIFQAMRRIADHLAHEYIGESAFERAVRSSFLGMILLITFSLPGSW